MSGKLIIVGFCLQLAMLVIMLFATDVLVDARVSFLDKRVWQPRNLKAYLGMKLRSYFVRYWQMILKKLVSVFCIKC